MPSRADTRWPDSRPFAHGALRGKCFVGDGTGHEGSEVQRQKPLPDPSGGAVAGGDAKRAALKGHSRNERDRHGANRSRSRVALGPSPGHLTSSVGDGLQPDVAAFRRPARCRAEINRNDRTPLCSRWTNHRLRPQLLSPVCNSSRKWAGCRLTTGFRDVARDWQQQTRRDCNGAVFTRSGLSRCRSCSRKLRPAYFRSEIGYPMVAKTLYEAP
jgi:hypothetical protein